MMDVGKGFKGGYWWVVVWGLMVEVVVEVVAQGYDSGWWFAGSAVEVVGRDGGKNIID